MIMTDQSYVLELLKENKKQLNEKAQNSIEISELYWSNENAFKYLDQYGSFDYLIGSDLIYAKEGIEPLVGTFKILSSKKSERSGKYPVVFMAVIRRFEWEMNFFKLMQQIFVQEKILEEGDICLYKYTRKE